MRTLKFNIKGQKLSKDPSSNFYGIIKGSKGYLSTSFSFDSEWNGLRKVIYVEELQTYYPLQNDIWAIPDELSEYNTITIRVYGVGSKQKELLTNSVTIYQEDN